VLSATFCTQFVKLIDEGPETTGTTTGTERNGFGRHNDTRRPCFRFERFIAANEDPARSQAHESRRGNVPDAGQP
jgi:hypothetical protein